MRLGGREGVGGVSRKPPPFCTPGALALLNHGSELIQQPSLHVCCELVGASPVCLCFHHALCVECPSCLASLGPAGPSYPSPDLAKER